MRGGWTPQLSAEILNLSGHPPHLTHSIQTRFKALLLTPSLAYDAIVHAGAAAIKAISIAALAALSQLFDDERIERWPLIGKATRWGGIEVLTHLIKSVISGFLAFINAFTSLIHPTYTVKSLAAWSLLPPTRRPDLNRIAEGCERDEGEWRREKGLSHLSTGTREIKGVFERLSLIAEQAAKRALPCYSSAAEEMRRFDRTHKLFVGCRLHLEALNFGDERPVWKKLRHLFVVMDAHSKEGLTRRAASDILQCICRISVEAIQARGMRRERQITSSCWVRAVNQRLKWEESSLLRWAICAEQLALLVLQIQPEEGTKFPREQHKQLIDLISELAEARWKGPHTADRPERRRSERAPSLSFRQLLVYWKRMGFLLKSKLVDEVALSGWWREMECNLSGRQAESEGVEALREQIYAYWGYGSKSECLIELIKTTPPKRLKRWIEALPPSRDLHSEIERNCWIYAQNRGKGGIGERLVDEISESVAKLALYGKEAPLPSSKRMASQILDLLSLLVLDVRGAPSPLLCYLDEELSENSENTVSTERRDPEDVVKSSDGIPG